MAGWVKAGVIENRFEGDRISHALSEAGIPFMVKSFLDTAYNGLYIPQKGWGAVMVPEELKEQAEKIIDDIKKSFMEEGKDETE
jgi:ketol-acid reductoisomerase